MGRYPSGQRGLTVNQLAQPSVVQIRPGPLFSGQGTAVGKSSFPGGWTLITGFAHVAQTVERVLGKDVAMGSIPIVGFANGSRDDRWEEERASRLRKQDDSPVV